MGRLRRCDERVGGQADEAGTPGTRPRRRHDEVDAVEETFVVQSLCDRRIAVRGECGFEGVRGAAQGRRRNVRGVAQDDDCANGGGVGVGAALVVEFDEFVERGVGEGDRSD